MLSVSRLIAKLCLSSIALLGSGGSLAEVPTEYKIQAGFLLHLTSYVHWVNSDKNERVICVRGDNPFDSFLEELVELRKINQQGEQLVVRYLPLGEPLYNCDVSFITHDELLKPSASAGSSPPGVLRTSNSPSFLARGGHLQFKKVGHRVRMIIDLDNSSRAKIDFSSELLQLAQLVKGS